MMKPNAAGAERRLMQEMGISPANIERRKAFVGLSADDSRRIERLRDVVQRSADELAATFFTFLSGRPEA